MIRALYITNFGLMDTLARTQIVPYLKRFAENGIKVYVISFERVWNLYDNALYQDLKKELEASGIEWRMLIYHSRWGNIWDIINGIFEAARITVAHNINIIHARASIPILIGLPISKLLGKKIIYDRRGTMAGDFTDDINIPNIFSKSRFLYKALDSIDRAVIKLSDGVILLSERSEAILLNNSTFSRKVKYEIIPCCVDLERFTLSKTDAIHESIKKDNNLCYLGSLGTCYLFDKMLDFFRVWKRHFISAKFIIISQTDREFIVSQIKNSGLNLNDFFILKVGLDKVYFYLDQCVASIMFIKPVECKISSSPTKFAESLASGVPVLINKGIGDMDKYIIEHRVGEVVCDFDEEAYEGAIQKVKTLLLDNFLKSRCRYVAENYFSIQMAEKRYLRLYHKICDL